MYSAQSAEKGLTMMKIDKIITAIDKSIMMPSEKSSTTDKIVQHCALLIIAFFIAVLLLSPLWIPFLINCPFSR